MYPKSLKDVDISVRSRMAIERRIVKFAVDNLLSQGFWLAVFDGEEHHKPTNNKAKLIDQLMETDEDYLSVYDPNNLKDGLGWVYFVYGNDGYDVISDYTVGLEKELEAINKFADSLDADA